MGANTYTPFAMEDGEISLTLNMRAVLELQRRNREWYDSYSAIVLQGAKDGILDVARGLYAAYLCACYCKDEDDRYGSFEEFLQYLPNDLEAMNRAYDGLFSPKKTEPGETL